MDVSIVIAHWNAADLLDACLGSIQSAGPSVSLEVVVVDNASTDNSVAMAREKYPTVRVVCNSTNLGFTVASNQGIRASKGEFVLLLNNDTEVSPGAIDRLVEYARAHHDVAVIGSKLVFPNGQIQRSCFRFFTLRNRLFHALFLHRILPHRLGYGALHDLDYETTHDVDWLMASAMLVRRAAMERVGLFDERSFVGGGDQDWCFRFRRSGYRVVFLPTSEVVHHHGKGTFAYEGEGAAQHRVRFFAEEVRSTYWFFQTHRGSAVAICYSLIAKLEAILRLMAWLGMYPFRRRLMPAFRADRSYLLGLVRVLALPLRMGRDG